MSALDDVKKCQTLRDVAQWLEYTPTALSYILYKIPDDSKYTTFLIKKKSGGVREINCPTPALKKLQKKLADLLGACATEIESGRRYSGPISSNSKQVHSVSHAFKKNHSIASNARQHRNKRYVLNIDLQDFFPSINFGRVRGFLIKDKKFQLSPAVATVIAQIACHKNMLPQGSPSSPIISDLVGHILDMRLVKIAKKNKCTYSRYADDLTFSTNLKDFPIVLARKKPDQHVWEVGDVLEKEISKSGFAINKKKTRLQS